MKQALFATILASSMMVACGGVDVPTQQDQSVTGVDDSSDAIVDGDDKKPADQLQGQAEGDTGEDGLTDDTAAPTAENATDPTDPGTEEGATTGVFANGATVTTTANLNLRDSASTSGDILRTIPEGSTVTVVNGVASNGFIKISHNGLQGFAAYRYLEAAAGASSTSGGSTSGSTSGSIRDKAIATAATGVGFSYWWGHGKWQPSGATSSTKGTCSGSCPSCSHGGSNGADCSGYVAKVWGVPSSNTTLSSDSHPYSTSDFYSGTGGGQWTNVSKSAIQKGDALVYRSGSAGHIVIYEKGDAWGSPWTYEARGCSYGIVHNVRSVSSSFKGIKRSSW